MELGEQTTARVLADYRTASIGEPLRATLGLLERVTLTPDEVTEADAASVRAAGVSDAAIVDALHVCYLFNIYDRLADAFDFHVPTEEGFVPRLASSSRVGTWSRAFSCADPAVRRRQAVRRHRAERLRVAQTVAEAQPTPVAGDGGDGPDRSVSLAVADRALDTSPSR